MWHEGCLRNEMDVWSWCHLLWDIVEAMPTWWKASAFHTQTYQNRQLRIIHLLAALFKDSSVTILKFPHTDIFYKACNFQVSSIHSFSTSPLESSVLKRNMAKEKKNRRTFPMKSVYFLVQFPELISLNIHKMKRLLCDFCLYFPLLVRDTRRRFSCDWQSLVDSFLDLGEK